MDKDSQKRKYLLADPVAHEYIERHAKDPHPYLAEIRRDCESHKWHFMLTTRQQAAFLHFIVRAIKAKKVLEIGSFFGHSALALASGFIEDGRLITIEHNPKFAAKTRQHLDASGCGASVEVLVGEAPQVLVEIEAQHTAGSFDLFFLDADKRHYPLYWETAIRLLRPDGLIVVDNVLAGGGVLHEKTPTEDHAKAVREFNNLVLEDRRVSSFITSISDGMLVARKIQS